MEDCGQKLSVFASLRVNISKIDFRVLAITCYLLPERKPCPQFPPRAL
jgi:hypothetical protein